MTDLYRDWIGSLRVARHRAAYLGRKAALATVLTEAAPTITDRLREIIGRPTLFDLQQEGSLSTSAREAIRASAGFDDGDWDQIESEFGDIDRHLSVRRQRLTPAYPEFFEIEKQTSLLLFGLTRLLKPACVFETGVADGASTSFILAALTLNGTGELHSLDIADDVGGLVEDRRRWHLHVVDAESVEDGLADLVRRLPPIELFFHDADHRFLPQLCEYETFAVRAPVGATLVSDDADFSYAFGTFCRRRGLRPSYLLDSRKVAGLVRL